MAWLGAIKAFAELPAALRDLTKELKELGNKLNDAEAEERLTEKRARNRDAIRDAIERRLSRAKDGQRGETHRPQ